MLLTFSLDKLTERIKTGVKVHTIREDRHDRWKEGMKIHFWRGNPRNVKNNPYQFGEGIVSRIDPISIHPQDNMIVIDEFCFNNILRLDQIAIADGFDSWIDMLKFFPNEFHGRLIHWKDFNSSENPDSSKH